MYLIMIPQDSISTNGEILEGDSGQSSMDFTVHFAASGRNKIQRIRWITTTELG